MCVVASSPFNKCVCALAAHSFFTFFWSIISLFGSDLFTLLDLNERAARSLLCVVAFNVYARRAHALVGFFYSSRSTRQLARVDAAESMRAFTLHLEKRNKKRIKIVSSVRPVLHSRSGLEKI